MVVRVASDPDDPDGSAIIRYSSDSGGQSHMGNDTSFPARLGAGWGGGGGFMDMRLPHPITGLALSRQFGWNAPIAQPAGIDRQQTGRFILS